MSQPTNRGSAPASAAAPLPRRAALTGGIAVLAALPAIAAPPPGPVPAPAPIGLPPGPVPASGGWISGLGRTISAVWIEHDRLDNEEMAASDPRRRAALLRAKNELGERAQVLSLAALNGRACSLSDAATQGALAAEQLEILASGSLADRLDARERAVLEAVQRGLVSIVLQLAGTSAEDLGQLGPLDFDVEANRSFPGAVTPAPAGVGAPGLFVRAGTADLTAARA
jgi:hypothetical protein